MPIKPAGSGENIVAYLARYVQHTVISDQRILHPDDESVRFSYTDSRTDEDAVENTKRIERSRSRTLSSVPRPLAPRLRFSRGLFNKSLVPASRHRTLRVGSVFFYFSAEH